MTKMVVNQTKIAPAFSIFSKYAEIPLPTA